MTTGDEIIIILIVEMCPADLSLDLLGQPRPPRLVLPCVESGRVVRRDGGRGAGVRMKTKLVSAGVYQRIISALRGTKPGPSVRIVNFFVRII